ncbi:MAG: A/G-specific adenine glycosylase [Aestuariivita sp.]|nr:A/G-specific adenine glycosylase [Aestuariivita sp.]
MRDQEHTADLLVAWYDQNARVMPWRVSPVEKEAGKHPNPYHVWLSEIMLQQTTVTAVIPYFNRFISLWPTLDELAAADHAEIMGEWAGLGYYARARNLIKCARIIVDEMHGQFPEDVQDLLKLPGIGLYTASAISAIAFGRTATVVDGNVERVIARLFDIHDPLPRSKKMIRQFAENLTPHQRAGDYAQAIMDLGATLCTPRNPKCAICPLENLCVARHVGSVALLPRKIKTSKKQTRRGIVYIGRRCDGAWLVENRPNEGLLGGMLGWPGSEWVVSEPCFEPPCDATWDTLEEEIRHTFSHFHLVLTVKFAQVPQRTHPNRGFFVEATAFRPSDLPTVMLKAFKLVIKEKTRHATDAA